jgi:hypothetical protein
LEESNYVLLLKIHGGYVVTDFNEKLSTALDGQLSNDANASLDNLIDWISTGARLDSENGDHIFSTCSLKVCHEPSDWGDWQENFEAGEFQLEADLFHNDIIPPRHTIELTYSPKQQIERINIIYEYYYRHLAVITVDAPIGLRPILKYAKSLALFSMVRYQVYKKKAKLRRIPIIGGWLANAYFKRWSGSNIERVITSLDVKSVAVMHEFEEWLDTVMTPADKQERQDAYERYWEGVPEDERGIEISVI